MPPAQNDRLNHAPDRAETALLLIDVINDLEFDGGEKLLGQALPMAVSLAALKRRAKVAGIPVIYVNDNFGRWRSDFSKLVRHCLEQNVRGRPVVAQLTPDEDDCVLFTANDAYMRDFQIAIPSDCVASEEAKLNRQALMLMQRVLKVDTTPSTELEFEDTKITFPQSSTAFRTNSTIR